jgi:hypothetical protein
MVNQNGYHNTRTQDGWELTHRLVAEKKLGRKLKANEMVRFVDNDRTNLSPDNIEIIETGNHSLRRKKASLEARIEELQAQLEEVNKELAEQ